MLNVENCVKSQEINDKIKGLNNNLVIDINNTSSTNEHSIISNDNKLILGLKRFDIDVPIFKYIIHNPSAQFIPRDILENYVGETNYHHQTPLMLAVIVNNINFVRQLIYYDIGKLDDYEKAALDYAYETHASQEIVDLLEEYEYGY